MYLDFIKQFMFHLKQCKNIRTNSYDYNEKDGIFTKTNHTNYSQRKPVIFLGRLYHILIFVSLCFDWYTCHKFSFRLVISFGIFIYRMALFNCSFLAYSPFIQDELLSFINRILKFERSLNSSGK